MSTIKPILLILLALATLTFAAVRPEAATPAATAPAKAKAPSSTITETKEKATTTRKSASRSSTATMAKPKAKPVTKAKAKAKPVTKAKAAANQTSKTKAKSGNKSRGGATDTTGTATRSSSKATLDLTPTQEDKLLGLLNRGSAEELTAISGISATRAQAIVSARPFQKVHDVIRVPGVGDATFSRIVKHGKTLTLKTPKSAKS